MAFFFEQAQQILAVTIFGQWLCQFGQLLTINETVAPGNFFQAGNLQALATFQGGNELAGRLSCVPVSSQA